jgi:hypothetical protein
MSTGSPYEFGPAPVGLRCPSCHSWRVHVEPGDFGDTTVRVVHERRCRTRWDMVARRKAELALLDGLWQRGMFVADYCAPPPKHRFLAGVT